MVGRVLLSLWVSQPHTVSSGIVTESSWNNCNTKNMWLFLVSNKAEHKLKGQTDEKLNFDGWIYISLGDNSYVFRTLKFVILTFFSHPANCTHILLFAHLSLTCQKIFVKFRCCLHSSSKMCKYGTRVQRSECEK